MKKEILSQENNQRRHLRLTFGSHTLTCIKNRCQRKSEGISVGGLGLETILAGLWERPWFGQEVSTDRKAPRHGLSAFGVARPHTMPQFATISGCPVGLPSHGTFRLQKAYQSHSPG